MVNNKDNFCTTVNLLQNDLINPLQNVNENKKTASTQTDELNKPSIDSHLL